tara:strand:- start:93 stop:533 length:441 start_codon:yes stop_codon:yes gene_type:complete
MLHSGSYNIDFIILIVIAFFLPAIIKNFMVLLQWMRHGNTNNTADTAQEALGRQQQWNMIVESAMIDAMSGNKSARDWVTKNVFSQADQESSSFSSTDRQIIRDAYDGLKSLGYKPKELRDKLKELCASKTYTNADDLIQDFIRGA